MYNCLGMIVFMDGGIVRFLMINLYVFFCDLCVVILKVGIIGNIVFFIWIGDFVVNKKFIVIVFIGIFFFRCEGVVFLVFLLIFGFLNFMNIILVVGFLWLI